MTLGDHVVIGKNANIVGHVMVRGHLRLGRIRIHYDVTVGVGVVVMPDVEIGEGSVVAANAVVAPGTRIPAGELWGGLPATKIKTIEAPQPVAVAEKSPMAASSPPALGFGREQP